MVSLTNQSQPISLTMDSLRNSFKSYGERTAALDPPDLELGLGDPGLPGDSKSDKSGGSRMLREPSIKFWKGSEEEAPAEGLGRSPHQRASEDPPEEPDRRLGRVPRSGQLQSGMLGRAVDEEEDDLFLEEDLPEEFKKTQFGAVTLLQWMSLVLIIGALVCTLAIPALKRRHLWKLKLWKWEVLVRVLICGRLVSGWMIRLVVSFIERNFLLRKRFLYFVYGLQKESLFNQYVIETLSGPPVIEIRRTEEEEQSIVAELQTLQKAGATVPPDLREAAFPTESGMVAGSGGLQRSPQAKNIRLSRGLSGKGEGGITIDHLRKLNPKNALHGFHSTLGERTQNSTHEDESVTMIKSENEAKAAATMIFQNVAKHGSKFIFLEDLMRFMTEDEALKTMSLFEGADECKRISKSSLKNWLASVNAFRERRALALTLNDTKAAVNELHWVVNVIVGIVILIIWLLILGIATSKFLLLLSLPLVLVAVAFIFGNTCMTMFEGIIFLFVMHLSRSRHFLRTKDRAQSKKIELKVRRSLE